MKPAPDYADLGGGLSCWDAYDPASKVELHATALQVGRRLYFIDPIPLEADALDTLTEEAVPAGIVLTNANHARAAAAFRRQFELPVWMHVERRGGNGSHRGRNHPHGRRDGVRRRIGSDPAAGRGGGGNRALPRGPGVGGGRRGDDRRRRADPFTLARGFPCCRTSIARTRRRCGVRWPGCWNGSSRRCSSRTASRSCAARGSGWRRCWRGKLGTNCFPVAHKLA